MIQGLSGIIVAGVGGGLFFGLRQWWGEWKERRLALPEHIRNAGFWTDRKVWWAQTLFLVALAAGPVSGIFLVLYLAGFSIAGHQITPPHHG